MTDLDDYRNRQEATLALTAYQWMIDAQRKAVEAEKIYENYRELLTDEARVILDGYIQAEWGSVRD